MPSSEPDSQPCSANERRACPFLPNCNRNCYPPTRIYFDLLIESYISTQSSYILVVQLRLLQLCVEQILSSHRSSFPARQPSHPHLRGARFESCIVRFLCVASLCLFQRLALGLISIVENRFPRSLASPSRPTCIYFVVTSSFRMAHLLRLLDCRIWCRCGNWTLACFGEPTVQTICSCHLSPV